MIVLLLYNTVCYANINWILMLILRVSSLNPEKGSKSMEILANRVVENQEARGDADLCFFYLLCSHCF